MKILLDEATSSLDVENENESGKWSIAYRR